MSRCRQIASIDESADISCLKAQVDANACEIDQSTGTSYQ